MQNFSAGLGPNNCVVVEMSKTVEGSHSAVFVFIPFPMSQRQCEYELEVFYIIKLSFFIPKIAFI